MLFSLRQFQAIEAITNLDVMTSSASGCNIFCTEGNVT